MKIQSLLVLFLFCTVSISAQFLDKKEGLKKFEGFYDFYYSEKEGAIYLEIPSENIGKEFLYVHSLRTGLGSNDIGLDRGQLGGEKVVKFIKSGNKLLLLEPNLKFRANTTNTLEKKSIEEAFAKSVLFGFTIKEESDARYIIDLSPFLLQDRHGVAQRLKGNKQGNYKLNTSRSTLWLERTKVFPKNVEFEALLTYVGEPKGRYIRSVAPDASSVSLIQHHSFIELPDSNYTPRPFDPRCGSYAMTYQDYATPIWEPLTKRFITRHRLEKLNPNLPISKAKEPIVYYLDAGTPEPVRSALLEGARWWNQAFEAIGYQDAFQVKMLPENADPMDVRYNVIQWVHRSTRGWSYGGSVTDPRTGEIIKGHVSLGSLRIRQDFMIAQALLNKPFAEQDDNYEKMLAMALARIRQLSAHEVGHTLGFAHNFAASTNNRASVMDYPHPSIQLIKGDISFENAYDTGIGEWDKVTVAYSYSEPTGNEPLKTHLNKILEAAAAKGLRYISDSDARASGGAHSKAHLWDNGANVVTELQNVLNLREKAIKNFSIDNIPTGTPYSVLEDVFVPLYFYHRYQTEAAVKLVGGLDYNYAVKGDGGLVLKTLPKKEQVEALATILNTLSVDALTIPDDKLTLFPPRAYGYWRTRESFKSATGVSFDALGAAATAAHMTLKLLLHPERLNRLVQQKATQPSNVGLSYVFNELVEKTFEVKTNSEYKSEVARVVQYAVFQQLLNAYYSKQTLPQVKMRVKQSLSDLFTTYADNDFVIFMASEAKKYEMHPDSFSEIKYPTIPDGSPIGMYQCNINE